MVKGVLSNMRKQQLERLPLRAKRSNRDTRIQSLDIIIVTILTYKSLHKLINRFDK